MLISNYTDLGLHPEMGGGIKIKFSFLMSFLVVSKLGRIAQNGGFEAQFENLACDPLKRSLFLFKYLYNGSTANTRSLAISAQHRMVACRC